LAEGTIYDFWDEAEHVIVSPLRAEYYIVGIDYGTGNPTAFILFGVKLGGRPSVWAEREYYWDARKMSRQKTDGEYAVNFREFLAGIQPLAIYVDPSAASFKLLLQQEGWGQIRDADNSVLDGIRTQARLLKNGEYRVGQECRQTIADYSQYVWDTKKAERGADAPMKVNDHTKDAERYALHSHFGLGLVNYQALNRW